MQHEVTIGLDAATAATLERVAAAHRTSLTTLLPHLLTALTPVLEQSVERVERGHPLALYARLQEGRMLVGPAVSWGLAPYGAGHAPPAPAGAPAGGSRPAAPPDREARRQATPAQPVCDADTTRGRAP